MNGSDTRSRPGRERVLWLRKPGPARVAAIVSEQSGRELSYREAGATGGKLPSSYRHDHWSADLGPFSTAGLSRAAEALRTWGIQRRSGMSISPGEPVQPGATFALVFRLPVGGYVTAAGRVVWVVDEPERYGFAYGTLPGHPERGEEAFVVSRQGDRMVFEITAFSRPGHWLARLGSPLTRMIQVRATRRYLAAMRQALA